MKSISIFVSSAQQEFETEREIAGEVIESLSLNPILFELSPASSTTPYEGFLNKVDDCDIFVMLLWKSFRPAVIAEYKKAIQKSKPILLLIKELKYDEKRDPDLNEFLEKYYDPARNNLMTLYREFRGVKDFRDKLKEGLIAEISKLYKDPARTTTREQMYRIGTSIISYTQKRLCMFQRTPSLFLGTKDRMLENSYDATTYQPYEKEFIDELENWIIKHTTSSEATLHYLFDGEKTVKELRKRLLPDQKAEKIKKIKEAIIKYKEIEARTNYRFRFTTVDTPVSGPFLVGDNQYGIWLMGNEDAISFSQENEKIATILHKMVESYVNKVKTAEELTRLLDTV